MNATILFPEETIISIAGQPTEKPWGKVPQEVFRAKILRPMRVDEMIDTLNALWTGLNATGASLTFGEHFIAFAPEAGFMLPAGGGHPSRPEDLTLTAEGLSELVLA